MTDLIGTGRHQGDTWGAHVGSDTRVESRCVWSLRCLRRRRFWVKEVLYVCRHRNDPNTLGTPGDRDLDRPNVSSGSSPTAPYRSR